MNYCIIWKENTGRFANGADAFSGKVKIGACRRKYPIPIDGTPSYRPFLEAADGFLLVREANTEDECKKLVEEAFEKYIVALELKELK